MGQSTPFNINFEKNEDLYKCWASNCKASSGFCLSVGSVKGILESCFFRALGPIGSLARRGGQGGSPPECGGLRGASAPLRIFFSNEGHFSPVLKSFAPENRTKIYHQGDLEER